jgi:Predicted membrane protein
MIGVGYDSITAISIALIGTQVGCLASTVNPFATGVASQTLGISPGDGLIERLILLVIVTTISIIYVMRYADKIKKDPSQSYVFDRRQKDLEEFSMPERDIDEKLSTRQKAVLWLFGLTFLVMIVSLNSLVKFE